MYPDREELERVFCKLDTGEILQKLSSGSLTPLAKDVALTELAVRIHHSSIESKRDGNTGSCFSTLETWVILIIIIGILPWSYYCMTSLALDKLFGKGFILGIIAPPVLIIVLVHWLVFLFKKY